MKYKLIKSDTFNALEVGKIYEIEDNGNHYTIINASKSYVLNDWQLNNMFEKMEK